MENKIWLSFLWLNWITYLKTEVLLVNSTNRHKYLFPYYNWLGVEYTHSLVYRGVKKKNPQYFKIITFLSVLCLIWIFCECETRVMARAVLIGFNVGKHFFAQSMFQALYWVSKFALRPSLLSFLFKTLSV